MQGQHWMIKKRLVEATTVMAGGGGGGDNSGIMMVGRPREAVPVAVTTSTTQVSGGGRGRSRKRSTYYSALSHYHDHFLNLLTIEYREEEDEVLGRIKASLDDPLGLESAGFALFDLCPERRGNLFSEEVYRLTKAHDATISYPRSSLEEDEISSTSVSSNNQVLDNDDTKNNNRKRRSTVRYLPPNHKFSPNDVIVLTLQPNGSGDFFSVATLPTSEFAFSIEARVLNLGPTYLDIAIQAGMFEAAFGTLDGDNTSTNAPFQEDFAHKQGPPRTRQLRLRADRFFSNIPYQRMVSALVATTSIPLRSKMSRKNQITPASADSSHAQEEDANMSEWGHEHIRMDEVIREFILSTHAYSDPYSPILHDASVCDLQEWSHKLAKPPMSTSTRLAHQVLKQLQSNPHALFLQFNIPQLSAIEAALTRRLTMIQGPPGTGKTTVGAAIAYGFVHQCRSISLHTKVLACAFSNVGADNLAEACLKLGLKVMRIGKPSAVTQSLWDVTLDAAIARDPDAQKAAKDAARATSQLAKLNRRHGKSDRILAERSIRDAATCAVKASIQAANIAATRALREADVIVSTSTGAADPRLMAACGLGVEGSIAANDKARAEAKNDHLRSLAPDNLPPISLPFVVIDEACQAVEPATLIPIMSSNSCRALVMLGDPCQLPATVRSQDAILLTLSLMERLAEVLPNPQMASQQTDTIVKDITYLDSLAVKRSLSLLRARSAGKPDHAAYRKRFSGSYLLSVQYRMHPSISALPSAIYYDGLLATPQSISEQRNFPSMLRQMMPCGDPNMCVRLIDVGGRANERQGFPSRFSSTVFGSAAGMKSPEEQTSYWNELEAERVVELIKAILVDPASNVKTIGVITPYNGQVQLIKAMIAGDNEIRSMLKASMRAIEVKSVDGYQGRERDVIIFSAVRSNRHGRIGFLHDWRRMNVALTRARSGLLVIGDFDTLAEADKHWAALHKWAIEARCLVNDYDCPEDELSV